MSNYIFTYNAEKAKECVKYLTKELGFLSKYTIAHLLFIAEMLHLQEFGRPIFSDRYAAVAEGALCSGILSIASEAILGRDNDFLVASGNIKALSPVITELMSESDLAILD